MSTLSLFTAFSDSGRRSGLRAAVAALGLLCVQGTFAQNTPAPATSPAALQFQEFFTHPSGPRGLVISDTLARADGQTVRITGYMVQQEQPPLGRFMLTPRPVRMSEHADGDADDLPAAWVMVYLDPAQATYAVPYAQGRLEVSGVLSVGRKEEQDGRVSWVRLQLAPEATRAMNAFEISNHLHAQQHQH